MLRKSLSVKVSNKSWTSFLAISRRMPVIEPLVSRRMRTSLGEVAALTYLYHKYPTSIRFKLV